VFIGLGNRDRGDDAVGLRFAEDLRHLDPNNFFSEEEGLEGTILDIIKRKDVKRVIFVDACDMGAEPGEIALMRPEDVKESISTHKVPLAVLMGLIRREGKEPLLLGFQPKSIEFEDGLSDIAEATLKKIEKAVKTALSK
jgi:hydrogenase maturation protease